MMQIAMKRFWQLAWQRLARPGFIRLPLLTAAEQTKRSWAQPIESYDEVPEVFKEFFTSFSLEPFPLTILTPSYEGFLQRQIQKLVCSPDRRIFILEKAGNSFDCTCYAVEDISCVEAGVILLHAWITFRGKASSGKFTSSTLKFNAVTESLFRPIIGKIRGDVGSLAHTAKRQAEMNKFDDLGDVSFKFMNFGKSSILPGETVSCMVLQPEIRTEIFRLFGRSLFRTVEVTHLTILTDRELIIIRDPDADKGVRYGGIWTYIPLPQITGASLAPAEDDRLALSIHLPGNHRIESMFSASKRQEVELLLNRLHQGR